MRILIFILMVFVLNAAVWAGDQPAPDATSQEGEKPKEQDDAETKQKKDSISKAVKDSGYDVSIPGDAEYGSANQEVQLPGADGKTETLNVVSFARWKDSEGNVHSIGLTKDGRILKGQAHGEFGDTNSRPCFN